MNRIRSFQEVLQVISFKLLEKYNNRSGKKHKIELYQIII
jgi:hypothetical protein